MEPEVKDELPHGGISRYSSMLQKVLVIKMGINYSYLLGCLSNCRISKPGCAEGDMMGVSLS